MSKAKAPSKREWSDKEYYKSLTKEEMEADFNRRLRNSAIFYFVIIVFIAGISMFWQYQAIANDDKWSDESVLTLVDGLCNEWGLGDGLNAADYTTYIGIVCEDRYRSLPKNKEVSLG